MSLQNNNKIQNLHYLLVPDAGAARRLRRLLCVDGARAGIIVGTWGELLTHACADYLVPAAANDWDTDLLAALRTMPDAAWSNSLEVATADTAATVWVAARDLLRASTPGTFPSPKDENALTGRTRQHLADLEKLVECLDGALPPDMYEMRVLLDTPDDCALRRTRVYSVADKPRLDTWQRLIADKLNAAADAEPDAALQALLETAVTPPPAAEPGTFLGALQTQLYAGGNARALDDTAQWIGARDDLQEAEVAAGMAQQLIAAGVEPREIGLLVPADERYYRAVRDTFDYAGLPLAGLPKTDMERDLGYEAVFSFLACKQRPAPAMALAACLTSPLMPWPRATGLRLAQTVMDGDYSLATPDDADAPSAAMLELLRAPHASVDELSAALSEFGKRLPEGDEDEDNSHALRAQAAIALLQVRLADMPNLDWAVLRNLVNPIPVTIADDSEFTRQGITVWLEEQTPWRPVEHLLVLGFRDRHYPRLPGYSPVFFPEDLRAINAACAIELDTNEALLKRRRACFGAQLASTKGSVSFLVPRRDAFGEFVAPASSLLFMASLVDGVDKPEDLVLDIESSADRVRVRRLAVAPLTDAVPPRPFTTNDPALGANLLALRTDANGNPAPQSPSRLENLIVSPFAWVLGQLRAEAKDWQPDDLSVLLKGSIAHDVFEQLFPKAQPVPAIDELRERLPDIYTSVIARLAPFLRTPGWHVEHAHLKREIADAAENWRELLVALNATVVDVEFWLAGQFNAQPIHGQVDALIALPDNRLIVVDFKKSSSGSRRTRMEKGYDSQVSLYRTMLETGGPRDDEDGSIAAKLNKAESIGVAYFTLNDGKLLADTLLPGAEQLAGWIAFPDPVSANAMALLRQRFAEVAAGVVVLNAVDDEQAFEKGMGIKPYAFDNSPLVRLFMRPEGMGGAA